MNGATTDLINGAGGYPSGRYTWVQRVPTLVQLWTGR